MLNKNLFNVIILYPWATSTKKNERIVFLLKASFVFKNSLLYRVCQLTTFLFFNDNDNYYNETRPILTNGGINRPLKTFDGLSYHARTTNATPLIATIINMLVIAPDRELDATHEIERTRTYVWVMENGVVANSSAWNFPNYKLRDLIDPTKKSPPTYTYRYIHLSRINRIILKNTFFLSLPSQTLSLDRTTDFHSSFSIDRLGSISSETNRGHNHGS